MTVHKTTRLHALLGLCLVPLGVHAQAVLQTEFPDGAVPVAPEVLSARVEGKAHRIKFSGGTSARIDYKTSGYAFLDMSTGFRDSGKWRAEGTKLCVEWRRAPATCSEVRLKGETIFVKRVSNGEIVTLEPD